MGLLSLFRADPDDPDYLRRKISDVKCELNKVEKEMNKVGYITIYHAPYEHGAGYPYNAYYEETEERPDRYWTLKSKYDRLSKRLQELHSKLDRTPAK